MAYANLLASSCVNPLETFQKFRNFMCKRVSSNGSYDYSTTGIGWTLIDSSYATNEYTLAANDYFVMYSAGEDGTRAMYIKVRLLANTFEILGCLYWDATAHTGTQQFGIINTSWTNTSATNNILWVYGDLDQFIGISKYSTLYYPGQGGWMPGSALDQTITVCPGTITAGSNVVVTFTAVPGAWAIGTKLFVSDNTNIERVTITNISGNDVTFAAFVSSYSASSKFSMERTEYVSGSASAASYDFAIGHSGGKDQSATAEPGPINPTSGDGLTGLYPRKDIYVLATTMMAGPIKNMFSTLSIFTSETTHTIGANGYRFFYVYSGVYLLIKEV